MNSYIPRTERIRQERMESKVSRTLEWFQAFSVAVILAVVIRLFVFEPFTVSGPSMQETMVTGDLVLVNKLVYKFREPRRGEIVVFHASEDKDFIKRVIGLPGETVEAKNNKILINGKIVEESYIADHVRTMDFDEIKVPQGKVFVLGDNRLNSTDSRAIGSISVSDLVGRAEFIYWPLTDLKEL
ncbi:signal peptidase I [Thermoactinomyces mirandus]|uniref:Signal peptidase I n=1 Tax=Thermoactinomyces mirandus TaxID=2756294 RepID=A0A7W2ARD1_9BACL|nr:signal peptidase I [Thermoactinomyces mirandus]MBA4602438.1 signal peptidase I [Thermoactinomyces mirandus]